MKQMDISQLLGDEEINNAMKKSEGGGGDYWRVPEGRSEIRFLPRLESKVPWKPIWSHRYENEKIIGTCFKTFGKKNCPVCDKSWALHESAIKEDQDLGMAVRSTVRYIMNIFVVKDETNPENNGKIKLISLGTKLYQQIADAYKSEDLGKSIFDVTNGFNFVIDKKKAGKYPDYSASRFIFKKTKLAEWADIYEKLINIDKLAIEESAAELKQKFSFLGFDKREVMVEKKTETSEAPKKTNDESHESAKDEDFDDELNKLIAGEQL
jgi:hypothetical protein